MYLYTKCKNCRKEFTLPYRVRTRPELSMEHNADEFNYQCPLCKTNILLHVNDVRAKASFNKLLIIGGIVLGLAFLLASVLFSQGLLIVSTIPFLIILMLYANENKNVHTFNSYLSPRI